MKESLFIKVGVMLLNGCLNKMTKKPFEKEILKSQERLNEIYNKLLPYGIIENEKRN